MPTAADAGPADRQVAARGPTGKDVQALLDAAEREGVAVLGTIVRAAVLRALAAGTLGDTETLFTPRERARLAEAIAATNATAELMARATVAMKAERLK